MDCIKPHSYESKRSKFSKTFSKSINPQTPSRCTPNQTQLKTLSQELDISLKEVKLEPKLSRQKSHKTHYGDLHEHGKTKVVKEAILAKLFASISSIKAAYAELQSAQSPYNGETIKSSDEDLVSELVVLNDLKQKHLSNRLELPPLYVTRLLSEIQEQQSNIKTYEITMKQMEWKMEQKDTQIASLRRKFEDVTSRNKSLEKRLNSSGALFPLGNNITISELNHCHFIRVLHHALRSLRHFVKQLVREMVSKNWDIDLAAKAIQPNTMFAKPKDKIYAFESYVANVMFDGFNHHEFLIQDEGSQNSNSCFESFKKMQSLTTTQIFTQDPKCPFVRFCQVKYLKVVHPKMECSFFGNLDQRKEIALGVFPKTEFFSFFAEMARRVWLIHCLAFSFDPSAHGFQVKKGSRFSDVYMENVAKEDVVAREGEFVTTFTVVPGFKIGKTVIQSLVYMSPG